tara:strand:- start:545 stop:1339 length:795 start_codon:yes stop_codon:yes gene_type:complete
MSQQSFLIKTKGYLLTKGTIDPIIASASWSAWLYNGCFAWAEQQKIELTGLAAKKVIPIPQGWSVQEMLPPRGYCYGLYQTEYNEQQPPTPNNLPWYCEIHDFWTTRKLTAKELGTIAGQIQNQRTGPAMEGYSDIEFTSAGMGPGEPPFLDWEMVVACRSRTWAPTSVGAFGYGRLGLDLVLQKQFVAKLHDNQWGSMEPIACLDLYHCRLIISNIDTESQDVIEDETGTFCDIPPSIQPMIVDVVKPNFITRVTYERRSKGI